MHNNTGRLEEIKKKNPFKTPEGYFDNLTANVLAQLPEKNEKEDRILSLWERVQPWIYMAAMFVGLTFMIRMFVGSSPNLNLNSSTDIDAFYEYYEEQLTNSVYHETLFLSDISLPEDYEY
jgi:hypothetical protein